MKPGYKQTEVGVIPEEWQVKPLRAVLSKGRLGGNYANQDRETECPLMKMGNIARGYIDTAKVEYIASGVTPERQHKLTKGDVLFNTRNTLDLVGKVAIWRDELPLAYYNSNLMRLEFDPQQVCSNEYANAALNAAVPLLFCADSPPAPRVWRPSTRGICWACRSSRRPFPNNAPSRRR